MEDVLDLYAEPLDPARPVMCLDESPLQLIGEVRERIPAAPGQLERVDYEYRRNGTQTPAARATACGVCPPSTIARTMRSRPSGVRRAL